MTILLAAIVLGVLIFVHELGHFLFAKWGGVGVEKFSLGFGPRLFGKKVGETDYILSAIPLGGYVKLMGDDPSEESSDPEKSFSQKPVGTRLKVVVAGPLFNLFFAVFVFFVVYMVGVPVLTSKIGDLKAGAPAQNAGLQKGDRIVAIEGQKVSRWEQMTKIVHDSAHKKLTFAIEREGKTFAITITPESQTIKNIFGEDTKVGLIGVMASEETITQRFSPPVAFVKGLWKTGEIISLTVLSIMKIIQRVVPAQTIGGPILIFKMAGEQAALGLLNLAFFVALLSINLGILNLLPIPVLDGGHIIFFTIEAIAGKPLSVKKKEIAQQVGLALLILIMLFAFYNDLMRIFIK